MIYRILYNPTAGNGTGEAQTNKLNSILQGDHLFFYNVLNIQDYPALFSGFGKDDRILVSGGDGTLNHFVNDTINMDIQQEVYFFPCGSGNDFVRDLDLLDANEPILVTPYLKNLPEVTAGGKKKRFINGIGYGLDGYTCEMIDKKRETSKHLNYKLIALKGLLWAFKPKRATIIVDGKKFTYEKTWLVPTMQGRYFGGGVMPTPDQNRQNEEHTVSVAIMEGVSPIKAVTIFPSMSKGTHVKHTECIHIFKGHEVEVVFDEPCAMQIDGEVVLGVNGYTVRSAAALAKREKESVR